MAYSHGNCPSPKKKHFSLLLVSFMKGFKVLWNMHHVQGDRFYHNTGSNMIYIGFDHNNTICRSEMLIHA
jgi:hypothetical protein